MRGRSISISFGPAASPSDDPIAFLGRQYGSRVSFPRVAEPQDGGAADYRPSHLGLLVDVSAPADPNEASSVSERGRILGTAGCVVLPTSRSFADNLPGLTLAVELALGHQCPLIVLCSQEARISEFPAVFKDKLEGQLTLINLAEVHRQWLPALASARNRISTLKRSNDVGSKRNIGLALAVSMGWQSVLFVDDDISPDNERATLNAAHLSHALSVMENDASLRAIGWSAHGYDDNSVVGHARQVVQLPQEVFIGGGALLVRCGPQLPFFPDIYNEDWLFLIALMADAPDHCRALGWGGRVHQRFYEPFPSRRAQSEEAGEIIGEGLMNLIEDHGSRYLERMPASYWLSAQRSRSELLQQIKMAALRQTADCFASLGPCARQSLIDAMNAAMSVHTELGAADLAQFVRVWRDDEAVWHRHLSKLAESDLRQVGKGRICALLSSNPFQARLCRTS